MRNGILYAILKDITTDIQTKGLTVKRNLAQTKKAVERFTKKYIGWKLTRALSKYNRNNDLDSDAFEYLMVVLTKSEKAM